MRGVEGDREKLRNIYLLFHLYIHWLLFVCVLTRDQIDPTTLTTHQGDALTSWPAGPGLLPLSKLPRSNSRRHYVAPHLLSSRDSPESINFVFWFPQGFALDAQNQTFTTQKTLCLSKSLIIAKWKELAFKIFFVFSSKQILVHYFKTEMMNPNDYFFLSSLLQHLKHIPGQWIHLLEKEDIYVQESAH